MSKLMWIAGILLIAFGAAFGLMTVVANASVLSLGVTPELAAILIAGGFLNIGVGGIIDVLKAQPRTVVAETAVNAAPAAAIPEFGRRSAEAAATVAVAAAVAPAAELIDHGQHVHDDDVSVPTRETIAALEQARQKIERAFETRPAAEPVPSVEPPAGAEASPVMDEPVAEEPAAAEEAAAEEEPAGEEELAEEGQLYVIEERVIRMRPARILSDGTVEAETDEGWMRFENLEHLDEYLDAISPAKS